MTTIDLQAFSKKLTIPTLPATVHRISELIEDPEAGLSEVGQRVAEDAPLAAKVLRIANSSYYGLPERCHSVEQACTVLGQRLLRSVVLQAAVIGEYEHLKGTGFDLEGLWRHAMLTAQTCSMLARRARIPGMPRSDEAYICGLLHDIGQVVLFDNLREEYIAVHEKAKRERVPLFLVERRELALTHADIGASVTTLWGFSPAIRAAIQFHHTLRELDPVNPAICLVTKANQLVERVTAGNPAAAAETFDPATLRGLGLAPQAVTEAIEYVQTSDTAALLG